MKYTAAISNFILIALLISGFFYLLFTRETPQPSTSTPNNSELVAELAAVNKNLTSLTETVQRFNTSMIQYDFLKGQLSSLSETDRQINIKAQATNNAKTDENKEEVGKVITQLSELSKQIKGAQKDRNETMLKLINSLERKLEATKLEEIPATPAAPEE